MYHHSNLWEKVPKFFWRTGSKYCVRNKNWIPFSHKLYFENLDSLTQRGLGKEETQTEIYLTQIPKLSLKRTHYLSNDKAPATYCNHWGLLSTTTYLLAQAFQRLGQKTSAKWSVQAYCLKPTRTGQSYLVRLWCPAPRAELGSDCGYERRPQPHWRQLWRRQLRPTADADVAGTTRPACGTRVRDRHRGTERGRDEIQVESWFPRWWLEGWIQDPGLVTPEGWEQSAGDHLPPDAAAEMGVLRQRRRPQRWPGSSESGVLPMRSRIWTVGVSS